MKRLELIVQDKKNIIVIPYYVFGKNNGEKPIFISGGIHGNELNGIALAQKSLQFLSKTEQNGELAQQVIVIPLLNPAAFNTGMRYVPEDRHDLNRSFGVDNPRNFSEKIAINLTKEIFSKCRLGIDCHDSGKPLVLAPHARVHITDQEDCISCSRELARLFGSKIVWERHGNPQMLAVHLNYKYKIPVITVEIGGNQTLYPEFILKGLAGIKNILISYEVLPGQFKLPKRQYVTITRNDVLSKLTGIVNFTVKLGEMVHHGEKIAEIVDPVNEKLVIVRAERCGLLFGMRMQNYVQAGDELYSLVEYKQCHNKSKKISVIETLGA